MIVTFKQIRTNSCYSTTTQSLKYNYRLDSQHKNYRTTEKTKKKCIDHFTDLSDFQIYF